MNQFGSWSTVVANNSHESNIQLQVPNEASFDSNDSRTYFTIWFRILIPM